MTSRADETKRKLLDAARALLIRGGAAALTMRAVAAEAGVALGNLQYHYATLGVLLEALLLRELSLGEERAAAVLTGRPEDIELPAVVDVMLADHENDELVRLFVAFWSLAATNASLRPRLRRFYDDWSVLIAEVLRGRCGLDASEAGRRARMFVACLEGLSLFRSGVAAEPNAISSREARALLVAILESGYPAQGRSKRPR